MNGIFDDPFDDSFDDVPLPAVFNEGCIPGWSVRKGGHVIGMGLTAETAVRLAVEHSAEIWGYGRTTNKDWPNVKPFESDRLAYVAEGMSHEDAHEYFEFNVVGAWVGPNTPLFVYDDLDYDGLAG